MQYWRRAIILVDMNAFFAAVEQKDHPEWRGRPVAITNGAQGSCIITCSYEARAYGIKTGMRLKEARRLCPDLIQVASRPERYASVSQKIMQALQSVTPDVEIFSVDEAFLDVTACQRLHGGALACAHLTKYVVFKASGLHCSVGLSSDKTAAKYAAKLDKPNGLTVIPPDEVQARFEHLPVSELCGISRGTANFLAGHAAYTCGDVARLPMQVLSKRFGNRGRRLWLMCAGRDPDAVCNRQTFPKSMGHGKVLPPDTRCRDSVQAYFLHMCLKLGARMRQNGIHARQFRLAVRLKRGWAAQLHTTPAATQDHMLIYAGVERLLDVEVGSQGVFHVQVTALDPSPYMPQLDIWASAAERAELQRRTQWLQAQDQVQQRYGRAALMPASLLDSPGMTDVIPPSWRASGHRQCIGTAGLPGAQQKAKTKPDG